MHFNDVYTYARPFARLENQDKKTTFLLRVLKVRLEEYLGFDVDDDMFCDIMEAAYRSNGSGLLPYGPMVGPQRSFVRLFKEKGYEENYKDTFIQNARDIIDWYTDKLFSPDTENSKITPVVFPFCRTVCDVERMIDDPLEQKNLGICYDSHHLKQTNGFFKVGHSNSIERGFMKDISLRHYLEHHHKMEKILLQNEGALLIDCHSFSSIENALTPIDPKGTHISNYDICIGYNEDKSEPQKFAIQTIRNHFASLGYKVSINTPFSNSKTFNSVSKYESIMIEINKKLYMDETTLEPNENFSKLHSQIIKLYSKLLEE